MRVDRSEVTDQKGSAEDRDETGVQENERRAFLAKCGRFAVITPPAVAILLSTALTSNAVARSGQQHHDD
jgi:hypothetical protein